MLVNFSSTVVCLCSGMESTNPSLFPTICLLYNDSVWHENNPQPEIPPQGPAEDFPPLIPSGEGDIVMFLCELLWPTEMFIQ
ncbi:hypothetical protein FBQ80_09065 [Candidatus Brocadia sp. AMX2]|nr:hypothetical protein [Candidatus Brocadia sp. AMX2]